VDGTLSGSFSGNHPFPPCGFKLNDGRVVFLTGEFLDKLLLPFEFRVLALLPGLNGLVADGGLVQNNPEPLDADGIYDFLFDGLIPETGQTPLGKRKP
jgi:hypothetical protein